MPNLPVTAEWLRAVRAAMAQQGWSQPALARHLGLSRSAVSTMLSRGPGKGSELVEPISRALGLPIPTVVGTSKTVDDAVDLLRRLESLDPEMAEMELQRIEMLVDKLAKRAKTRP